MEKRIYQKEETVIVYDSFIAKRPLEKDYKGFRLVDVAEPPKTYAIPNRN